MFEYVVQRAMRDYFAAMRASAQSHIHHMIGATNRIFIMLYHQHCVTDVTQMFQCRDQAVVVALVQADRGLVEYIHHTGQA